MREVVWSQSELSAGDYPVPERAWSDGCDWPVSFAVQTQPDWASGFYEIELIDAERGGHEDGRAHAFFVLRSKRGSAKRALLVLSSTTYAAYNYWGGGCLYTGETSVSLARPLERGYLRRPAAPEQVSFDGRACNVSDPSDPTHQELLDYQELNNYPLWTNSAGWHNWERRFASWAERDGWLFDYSTSLDLHHEPNLLDDYSLLLTVGHDEYWSAEMRDAVESFVRSGGNWFVMSGDTATWQVRIDGARITCYKSVEDDPISSTEDAKFTTTMWSDPFLHRPETELHGLTFTRGGYHRIGGAIPEGSGGYTIHKPEHWLFDNLDLSGGDLLGSRDFVVGYEVNGCALRFDGALPTPTHSDGAPESLEILATAPARLISINSLVCEAPAGLWASLDPPGDLEEIAEMLFGTEDATGEIEQTFAVVAVMKFGKGTVLNTGSADWAYGLDRDEQVQQATRNALLRFNCSRVD